MNYKEDPSTTWIVLQTKPGGVPEYVATLEDCFGIVRAASEYSGRYLHDEQDGTIITLINKAQPSSTSSFRVKAAKPTLEGIPC